MSSRQNRLAAACSVEASPTFAPALVLSAYNDDAIMPGAHIPRHLRINTRPSFLNSHTLFLPDDNNDNAEPPTATDNLRYPIALNIDTGKIIPLHRQTLQFLRTLLNVYLQDERAGESTSTTAFEDVQPPLSTIVARTRQCSSELQ